MTPYITTFFTANYLDHAKELVKSGRDLGLHVEVTMYCHLKGWHQAVAFKPQHILLQLQSLPLGDAGMLWVDADARFRQVPDWKVLDDADVAACLFRWSPHHSLEVLTGTLFFRNSPRVIDFVKAWCAETEKYKNTDTPEQRSLAQALEADKKKQLPLRFKELPVEWVWIEPEFNSMFVDKRPVISHLQASRQLK